MTIRQVAPLLISSTLALSAAACAASPPADPVTEPRGATSSAAPAGTAVATPSPLRLPGMDTGTKTVLKAGPRKGSMVVGDIPPGKDELWVLFKCRGQGKVEIVLEPGINMPFTCLDDVVSPIMNRLDLGERKTLTVRIQATDAVEWALRITR
ncbi:hypothetical protein [Nonomuraea harbinensis]|uniref:Lipoprotein n=1 Tax=Nonomuraea harbinensis TaxID=1286938 RepID=A0ABW1BZ90_9ACTN|nr:hypothetical protein [Nonomuraea harbinensis]